MNNNRIETLLNAVDIVCGECPFTATNDCSVCPVRKNVDRLTVTKQQIYDELSRVLTEWENQEAEDDDLYNMLVKIQRLWETVITRQED